jgi:hypothetical protein
MRWILPLCFLVVPVCFGCSTQRKEDAPRAAGRGDMTIDMFKAKAANVEGFVQQKDQGPNQAAQPPKGVEPEVKKEKPRKIRYSADMKLIVKNLDEAEEALDAARKEAKGEYEKAEVNSSANIVRTGMWRVRVPVENLHSFRKAVKELGKKLGDIERDTIESEDLTAKYYDLDAHLTNRKAEQLATREFLVEIGKKDPRYLEVKRELDAISDDINRKEGQLKLWANLTDLTTFTIHMSEKQPYLAAPKIEPTEVPTFGLRASTTWNTSWDAFVGFLQWVAIIAIAVTPWLPIPLIFCTGVWLIARRLFRTKPEQVIVLVEAAEAKKA